MSARLTGSAAGVRGRNNAQAGFTLIEILVALAVLAMVFAAGLEVFSRGLSALSVGDARTTAAQYARSKFDEVMGEGPREGARDGRARYQGLDMLWRITVNPYEDDALGPTSTRHLRLLEVQVEVMWQQDGRQHIFSLSSLTLTTEPQA